MVIEEAEVVNPEGKPTMNLGVEIGPFDALDLASCVLRQSFLGLSICITKSLNFFGRFALKRLFVSHDSTRVRIRLSYL